MDCIKFVIRRFNIDISISFTVVPTRRVFALLFIREWIEYQLPRNAYEIEEYAVKNTSVTIEAYKSDDTLSPLDEMDSFLDVEICMTSQHISIASIPSWQISKCVNNIRGAYSHKMNRKIDEKHTKKKTAQTPK